MNTIGENIKKAREKIGYTQDKLAQLLNVNCQTVWRWEKGSRGVQSKKLYKIAEILNVTVASLLNEVEDSSTSRQENAINTSVTLKKNNPTQVDLIQSPSNNKIDTIDVMAIDTLAMYLRDRIKMEKGVIDERVRYRVQEALHECLHNVENYEVEEKQA